MPKRRSDIPAEFTAYERAVAEAIGARIRQRRSELELTQGQVRNKMEHESVSVTRTQFSRIELGESLLTATEIIALATVLDVSCCWLFEGKPS